MKLVYADTGYWIALLNPRDDLHDRAVGLTQSLSPLRIVTSEAVLTEWLNDFAGRGPRLRQAALAFIVRLRSDPRIEVIPQSSVQFDAALDLYSQRHDKTWGLTDCISFCIMSERGIEEALAYDHHFEQAGFRPLLRTNKKS